MTFIALKMQIIMLFPIIMLGSTCLNADVMECIMIVFFFFHDIRQGLFSYGY